MSQSLADIRAQIAELQRMEEEILSRDRADVIVQIRQQILDYGLSAADLGFTVLSSNASGRLPPAQTDKIVKYRCGDETWSGGRGPKPKWVREVIARGEDIEQYRI